MHDQSMFVGHIDTYIGGSKPQQSAAQAETGKRQYPEELNTAKAKSVLSQLCEIGVLDENYQPIGLSWFKRGYLAYQIAFKLAIENVWTVFANLWNVSANTLRAKYNEAKDMPSMADFDEKIKGILG